MKRRGTLGMRFKEVQPDSEEVVHLKIALQSMIDAYYRLTDPLPRKTLTYQLCSGAFGNVPEIASELLKGK